MSTNRSIFDPIEHESVADAVTAQVEQLIVTGVLKQGQKLPSERELAEMLDVSRPKLREALKRLEQRDLIRVQHGGGTYIAPLIGSAMSPALIDLYARHTDAFYDYLEYRREQEAFAARLAAERATPADLDIIKSIINNMEEAFNSDNEELEKKFDIDFHTAVVDASHNSTLVHMMGSVFELTRQGVFYNRSYLRSIDGTGKALLEQHREIGNAIVARDPAAATEAAISHLNFVEQTFIAGQKQTRREKQAEKRHYLSTLK